MEAVARRTLASGGGTERWELLVEVTIPAGGTPSPKMAWRGNGATNEGLQAFYDGLSALPAPVVREGPVSFHVSFAIGHGTAAQA